jgi:hypothetical protein
MRTSATIYGSLWTIVAATIASCTPAHPAASHWGRESCALVTIDDLWRDPPRFEGRRVCVTGFLGQLIPYGEATPELFRTRAEAESTHSDHRVVLGLPFTLLVQERLSRYSLRPLRAEGVFNLESECRPTKRARADDTVCEAPPEMRISSARLRFADGARFGLTQ